MDPRHSDHDTLCPKPPSFFLQLKVYNGTFSDESLWKIFLRPYPFILSPVVRVLPIAFSWCTYSFAQTISQTWLIMFLPASLSSVWYGTCRHL